MIKKRNSLYKLSPDPNENWDNDLLQFARLIAECEMVGSIVITDDLCSSMSLPKEDVESIIERAQLVNENFNKQIIITHRYT